MDCSFVPVSMLPTQTSCPFHLCSPASRIGNRRGNMLIGLAKDAETLMIIYITHSTRDGRRIKYSPLACFHTDFLWPVCMSITHTLITIFGDYQPHWDTWEHLWFHMDKTNVLRNVSEQPTLVGENDWSINSHTSLNCEQISRNKELNENILSMNL